MTWRKMAGLLVSITMLCQLLKPVDTNLMFLNSSSTPSRRMDSAQRSQLIHYLIGRLRHSTSPILWQV